MDKKCCIFIDDCANVLTEYNTNLDEYCSYCEYQDTCEDFDPIWTDQDADDAIRQDLLEGCHFTKEEVEKMFTDDEEYREGEH